MSSARVGVFAILLLVTSAARASDAVLAEALFREGRAASDAGDLATACSKFAQSYRLDPAPGTLLNLGDCEERRGKLASAWETFNRLYDTLAPTDDRRTLARGRSDAIAARLARVRITLAKESPADARVLRDGTPLDPAALGTLVPIDPGAHVLVVHVPDHVDKKIDIKLAEGEKRDVTLEAGPLVPPVVVAPPPPEHHGLGTQRIVGLVIAGGGVLALGGGFVTGGIALSTESRSQKHCTGSVCSDQAGIDLHETAKTEALVADIVLGVGVVALAVGAVLFLTGKPSHKTNMGLVHDGFAFGGVF